MEVKDDLLVVDRSNDTRTKLHQNGTSVDRYDRNSDHSYHTYRPAASERNHFSKRILDCVIGTVGMMSLAFLYPIVALGIKLSSPGPVLFRQQRTGLNGDRFSCYKFRTMHVHVKEQGSGTPNITNKKDPRVFSFGSFLRKTNLDEFPQFYNVIKGDMSIVGPRPYPVQECNYWCTHIENFGERYSIRPGITGLAQVRGYRGGTLDIDHMKKRVNLDFKYIQTSSLEQDLKIISQTFLQMLKRETNGH